MHSGSEQFGPADRGKATLVRVYPDPTTVSLDGDITGELAWSHGGAEAYLPALNSVRLKPSQPDSLKAQREDLSKSLNFKLPADADAVGELSLRISRIYQPGGAEIPVAPSAITKVTFSAAPPLRIRVIGLRYNSGANTVTQQRFISLF